MNSRGLSHYVDGELQGKPGFQVPEGLHRERDPRRRAGKEKKMVMRPGLGMSVEWKSDGVLSVTLKESGKLSDHEFIARSQSSRRSTPASTTAGTTPGTRARTTSGTSRRVRRGPTQSIQCFRARQRN